MRNTPPWRLILPLLGLAVLVAVAVAGIQTGQWVDAVSAAGSFVAGMAAVWAILELREDRLERNRPLVVAYTTINRKQAIFFRVANKGAGDARDIRFEFEPMPNEILNNEPLENVTAFGKGIPALQAGEELLPRILWFGARSSEPGFVPQFNVTVRYKDTAGREYSTEYLFDFEPLKELQLNPPTTEELLEDFRDTHRKVVAELREISVAMGHKS